MRVRDKIHGDMEFTKDEEQIIRSKSFQRLQRIKQLGSTNYVYPGARHSRFDHSLGTCHLAGIIANTLKNQCDKVEKKIDIDSFLIRKAALIHDISHIPFGHMLEDEVRLIQHHEKRYDRFLEDDFVKMGLGNHFNEVVKVLTTDNPYLLDAPFIGEIIHNTISADLLDYVRRDSKETGLNKDYDNRIFSYFRILNYENKEHLVIDIQEQGVRCPDVVTEIEDLLRLRYILAERVYNYHTKIQADAMIAKALDEAFKIKDIKIEDLYDLGDDELVYLLSRKDINPTTCFLASEFRDRRLYRTTYMIDYQTVNNQQDLDTVFNNYSGRENACKIEKIIAESIKSVQYKDVILFCHDPKMNQKYARALVRKEDNSISAVQSVSDEFKSIIEKHRSLWRLYVFSKVDTDSDIEKEIGKKCEEIIGFKNQWDPISRRSRGLYY